MALRSELLTVNLQNNKGENTKYYTYDGYLEQNDRHTIRAERRDFEKLRITGGAVTGLLAFVVTRRLHLPVLSLRGISLPLSGLASGVVGSALGYNLLAFYGGLRLDTIQRNLALSAKHLPLWSNLRNAVNPDRAFFELADQRNNEPLLFHSGLTPSAAERLIPDKIIGTVPHKPHYPSAHGHGHH